MRRMHFIVFFVLFFPLVVFANGEVHDGHAGAEQEMTPMLDGGPLGIRDEDRLSEGLVVNMTVSLVPVSVGTPARLDFLVNVKPGNVPVPFYELDVTHTKLMHVIGVRSDLNEFRHVHPEPSPDNAAVFSLEHTFDNAGEYKFWSEISRARQQYTFGHPLITIVGTGTPDRKDISLARNVIVGNYQVALSAPERIAKGRDMDLTFEVHTLVGDGVALGEYLGEPMHLIAIRDDLSEFIHGHPAGAHTHAVNTFAPRAHAHGPTGDAPGYEPVNFHIAFPAPGFYKLFAQFRPEGSNLTPDDTLTAAFWVEVREGVFTPTAQRLTLAAVSLLLTTLLSVGVYRYMYRLA